MFSIYWAALLTASKWLFCLYDVCFNIHFTYLLFVRLTLWIVNYFTPWIDTLFISVTERRLNFKVDLSECLSRWIITQPHSILMWYQLKGLPTPWYCYRHIVVRASRVMLGSGSRHWRTQWLVFFSQNRNSSWQNPADVVTREIFRVIHIYHISCRLILLQTGSYIKRESPTHALYKIIKLWQGWFKYLCVENWTQFINHIAGRCMHN